MSYAVYVYTDENRNQEKIASSELNWTGTWSPATSYFASSFDAVLYGPSTRYIAVRDNAGVNPLAHLPDGEINPFAQLIVYEAGDEPPFPLPPPLPPSEEMVYTALVTAWSGTAEAAAAVGLANQALIAAFAGTLAPDETILAYGALQTAWAGTSGANSALALASRGTNEADAAISLGNYALTTAYAGTAGANSAIVLANSAIVKTWSGTSGVASAMNLAAAGTNAAATALALAALALETAWAGTTSGSDPLAYTALQTAWAGTAQGQAAIGLANQAVRSSWAGTNGIDLANDALETAWAGTTAANLALSLIATGTGAATALLRADQAYALATAGTNAAAASIDLANQALVLAWAGTANQGSSALAYTALQTAWAGTAGAASGIGLASQALVSSFAGTAEANAALGLANKALTTAFAGTSGANAGIALANQALQTAWLGTNASGSSALAQAAYDMASIGTNVGTNALTVATSGSNLASSVYTQLGSPTGGNVQVVSVTADKWRNTQTVLAYGTAATIDFNAASAQRMTLTGDWAPTTANLAADRMAKVRIDSTSAGTFTWPAAWDGAADLPAYIPANKVMILALECWGTTESDITASAIIFDSGYVFTGVAGALLAANNLSDLGSLATAQTNLGAGAANGLATLDATAKVPSSQLPSAIVGAVTYQGVWNASTNTPDIGASSPVQGNYYVVSVAGTTSLGGITDWNAGDWAIYDGAAWGKVDNTQEDATATVKGRVKLAGALGGTADSPALSTGSGSDAVIGDRTIDDSLSSPASTGALAQLLSWIAGRIKGITGKASWLTAPRTTLENAVKLNGDTMTGALVVSNRLTTDKLSNTQSALTYGATADIDFDGGSARTLVLTGNWAPTTSNRAAGRIVKLHVTSDATERGFTWPNWNGADNLPVLLPASRTMMLLLECWGTADTDITATATILDAAVAPSGTGGLSGVISTTTDFYVRKDGSDANAGTANTAGGAWLTIQKAIDYVTGNYIINATVIIHIGDGTYDESVLLPSFLGKGGVTIQGNTSDMTLVHVVSTAVTNVTFECSGGIYTIRYVKVTGPYAFYAKDGGVLRLGNFLVFSSTSTHILASKYSKVELIGNYTIGTGGWSHFQVTQHSSITVASAVTATVTGTPAFTNFAYTETHSSILVTNLTFSGGATGARYSNNILSVMQVPGGSLTFFPGNSNGSTGSGSIYG